MSSLKATQADGYYVPAEYLDAGKEKQFKSGKGHNQYLTHGIVRFELPYDGFCLADNCKAHVGKGTRFNAKKEHSGDYYSTKIYDFTMKCRHCKNLFVLRTNPKEKCYDYISGIKRKVEEFDTVAAESLGVIDTDYGNSIHNFTNGEIKLLGGHSALNKLEEDIFTQKQDETERQRMERMIKKSQTYMLDDSTSNAKMRASYRQVRQAKKRRLEEATRKGLGRDIEVADSTVEDTIHARIAFQSSGVLDQHARQAESSKFQAVRQSKLFDSKRKINDSKNSTSYLKTRVKIKVKQEEDREEQSNSTKAPRTKKLLMVSSDGKIQIGGDNTMEVVSTDDVPSSHFHLQTLLNYGSSDDGDS